uniref:Uncharacterized protein n=1 Tax=Romanomermis culicivorax TaxID=13658 RepID=A0A915HP67_ROMCU
MNATTGVENPLQHVDLREIFHQSINEHARLWPGFFQRDLYPHYKLDYFFQFLLGVFVSIRGGSRDSGLEDIYMRPYTFDYDGDSLPFTAFQHHQEIKSDDTVNAAITGTSVVTNLVSCGLESAAAFGLLASSPIIAEMGAILATAFAIPQNIYSGYKQTQQIIEVDPLASSEQDLNVPRTLRDVINSAKLTERIEMLNLMVTAKLIKSLMQSMLEDPGSTLQASNLLQSNNQNLTLGSKCCHRSSLHQDSSHQKNNYATRDCLIRAVVCTRTEHCKDDQY